MHFTQDAYPQRPKAIHFMNMPSFIDMAFNLMKSFAKDKMKERMLVIYE